MNLLNAVKGSSHRQDFSLVSVQIGVNDQFQGRSIDEFRVAVQQILLLAVQSTTGRAAQVLVLSIPDWTVTPAAKQLGRSGESNRQDTFAVVQVGQYPPDCEDIPTPVQHAVS